MLAHFILDLIYFLSVVEVRDFSHIKDVVDVFNEVLLLDVRIRESKDDFFVVNAKAFEHALQIVLPLKLAIALRNLYLEDLALVDEGSQLRQTLSAITTQTYEKSIAVGLKNNS